MSNDRRSRARRAVYLLPVAWRRSVSMLCATRPTTFRLNSNGMGVVGFHKDLQRTHHVGLRVELLSPSAHPLAARPITVWFEMLLRHARVPALNRGAT